MTSAPQIPWTNANRIADEHHDEVTRIETEAYAGVWKKSKGTVGPSVIAGVRVRMKDESIDATLIRQLWLEEKRAMIGDRARMGHRLERECYDRVCARLRAEKETACQGS